MEERVKELEKKVKTLEECIKTLACEIAKIKGVSPICDEIYLDFNGAVNFIDYGIEPEDEDIVHIFPALQYFGDDGIDEDEDEDEEERIEWLRQRTGKNRTGKNRIE